MIETLWHWLIAPAPNLELPGRALLPGLSISSALPIVWIGLIAAGIAMLLGTLPRRPSRMGLAALAIILTILLLPHMPRALMLVALGCSLISSRSGGPNALLATALLWSDLFPSGAAVMMTIAAFWLAIALFRLSANDNPFSERYSAIRWVPARSRHVIEQVTQKSGE